MLSHKYLLKKSTHDLIDFSILSKFLFLFNFIFRLPKFNFHWATSEKARLIKFLDSSLCFFDLFVEYVAILVRADFLIAISLN